MTVMSEHKERKRLVAKHQVMAGRPFDDKLVNAFRAGEAFLHEDDSHYVLKIAAFPFAYYLQKNRESEHNYTIYAKKILAPEGPVLRDPIGRGRLTEDLRSFLELTIPIFRLRLFMNLYPV
jgi:hypothetical protein